MTIPPPSPAAPGPSGDFSGVPPYGAEQPMPKPGNGMAVAALVLGIISVPLFFLNWFDAIIAILAIVFGILGMRRASRNMAGRRGMSIAGLVLGAIGLIASVVFLVVVVLFATSVTQRCEDHIGHAPNSAELQQCILDGV